MMTDKTLYTEEETAAIANSAAYRARLSTVLGLLIDTYQAGPEVVRTTLDDIRRDYGLTQTPAPTPPGGDRDAE